MIFSDFWNCVVEMEELYSIHRRKVMDRFSLSAIEVDILLFLANNPGINTAAEMIRLRKFTKSHVSMAIKSLSEKKLIQQNRSSEDRKRICLSLTDDAQEIIKLGQEEQISFLSETMRDFSEEDKSELMHYMVRIKDNVHAACKTIKEVK